MAKTPASDQGVLHRIQSLVDEEHRLLQGGQATGGARLDELQVELDQCWDLLRQRRALREFGDDPDQAKVRPAKVVEDYQQ
jgi:Protein of unknown function (DUF2630)